MVRNSRVSKSSLVVLVVLAFCGTTSASDKEVVFHPLQGFFVRAGQKLVFSTDASLAFALAESETFPLIQKIMSFRTDIGDLVDQFDLVDFETLDTITYDAGTRQIALFGLDGLSRPEVLFLQVDSEGRFVSSIDGELPPIPAGFWQIVNLPIPVFLNTGKLVVQPFASRGSIESVTSLYVLDSESGSFLGHLDLRSVATGFIRTMATDVERKRVALQIQPFDGTPDVVAVCSISEAGIPRLERVISPGVQRIADEKFDPLGRFLFILFQESDARAFTVDLETGDIIQTKSLGFEVIDPSVSVDEIQVNATTRRVGIIGTKAVAFLPFDENGQLGEITKVKADETRSFNFEDTDLEFLPGGFHAVTFDFKRDNMLLVDTGSGAILETIPIVFNIPASVAADGTVAVTDNNTDAIHLYTFDLRPQIVFVEAKKKKINIFGVRILEGAIVEIDGTAVPATLSKNQLTFTVKQSVAKGQTVMVEIVNPDGSRSGKVPVTR